MKCLPGEIPATEKNKCINMIFERKTPQKVKVNDKRKYEFISVSFWKPVVFLQYNIKFSVIAMTWKGKGERGKRKGKGGWIGDQIRLCNYMQILAHMDSVFLTKMYFTTKTVKTDFFSSWHLLRDTRCLDVILFLNWNCKIYHGGNFNLFTFKCWTNMISHIRLIYLYHKTVSLGFYI